MNDIRIEKFIHKYEGDTAERIKTKNEHIHDRPRVYIISKIVDREFKVKQNARQRECRQRKKKLREKQQLLLHHQQLSVASRKAEGIKRRRANTRKLKREKGKIAQSVPTVTEREFEDEKIIILATFRSN